MLHTLWEQTWYPSLLLNCPSALRWRCWEQTREDLPRPQSESNWKDSVAEKGPASPQNSHLEGLGVLVHTGNPSAEELETARLLGSLASQPTLFSKSQARSQKFEADGTWEMTPEVVVPWPTDLHTCKITEAGRQILCLHKLAPNTLCLLKTDNT